MTAYLIPVKRNRTDLALAPDFAADYFRESSGRSVRRFLRLKRDYLDMLFRLGPSYNSGPEFERARTLKLSLGDGGFRRWAESL